MKLDKGTFLIVNKYYYHANLAMWGTKSREMGTHEQKVELDQFWQLKEDANHPGYYYIYNLKYDGYRVAKWGPENNEVGSYNGQYFDNQMWKFENEGDGFYRIYNFKYSNSRITKFGKDDENWGTYDGAKHEDQLWKLVPRYKADVCNVTIWSCDNRQGSEPFSEEIFVMTGLKLTSSTSISTTVGLETSLKASLSIPKIGVDMETRISTQIENSLFSGLEEDWSRTSKIKFTAPSHKNYRVKKLTCDFLSPLASDDCTLKCEYVVEETSGEFD
ncbi:uncharacterized protein LOC124436904 [Xenia sp. Carnegie-2017]|uniref:uncharacterized protein LOC124436904 n=1 Tax=Xenia sp. Carnegie-2017 TaxID=2897299 RepID=UPI001F049442|nr:uncharacterized protein LOC124436904 [Xenia sp. Carnegie-2017]